MRFVVASDGSEHAWRAGCLVASLPLSAADDVIVASIIQPPTSFGAWGYVRDATTSELYSQAQRDACGAVAAAAASFTHACCAIRQIVREGDPAHELIALVEETDPDVLVVGPHGRGRLESMLLGSVSQSLLNAMPAPVLVVRGAVRAPRRILLATDGSPPSLAATRLLARFPLPADAQIFVLTVVDARQLRSAAHQGGDLVERVASVQRGAARLIHRSSDLLTAAGVTAKPVIEHGDPTRAILGVAAELRADLVVTGARGIGGFRGLVLGRVSRAVSRAAPCSTLVVAADPADARGDRNDE